MNRFVTPDEAAAHFRPIAQAAVDAYLAAGDALNAAKVPSDWPSHMHLDERLHAYLADGFHPARVCSGRERLGE